MIDDLKADARSRMAKAVEALRHALARIRTGRAHPSLLEGITVNYYGVETPLNRVANIHVADARTLTVVPWEKKLVPEIEKAILKSDLGLNPATAGEVIRIPLPPLTEETRKALIRQARHEAEQGRVSIRNIRRDVLSDLKELLKERLITEDEERRAQEEIQRITDRFVAQVDELLAEKEKDLMEI
ncbi:MAG: ribosome-recycling factor [Porticoccaceae bacterium]|nr:MAG: ribosome-recycling factor [Porticoccaceae bacterium]